MKRYILIGIAVASSLTFAASCGNHDTTDETVTDTAMNTLPAESAPQPSEMAPGKAGDTMATPRLDPQLDSAARQGTMPPK